MEPRPCGDRERLLLTLTKASSEALVAWSADGRVAVWSPGAERLYGYSEEEASALTWSGLLAPEDRTLVPFSELVEPVSRELLRLRKNGSPVRMLVHLRPVRDEGGCVVGLAEVGRLAPGAELFSHPGAQTSRQHLSAIVESSQDAIVSKTLKGVIQSWNRGAERIFGYSADEVIGRPISILIPPDRQDEEIEILSRIRAGERVEHYETVRMRKDGRQILVSLTISPIYDNAGRIVGASKIARDMTLVRRAERELSETQTRLRMLVESAPVILFTLDKDGYLELLEGRALSWLGFKREALVGQCFRGRTEGAVAWFSAYVERALEGERCQATVLVAGRLMEVRWFPIDDEAGQTVGVSGVALDVTEQRRRQDDAVRASKWESVGILAGGIAHDFNNVLAAIVGNLALARAKAEGVPEVARFLQECEKAALRARGLTQQLLGFAKGGQAVRRRVDVAPLVESTVQFALGGSNVRGQVLVARELWQVEADEAQLSQVINNLVINAQQAMPKGGILEVLARNVSLRGHENALPPGDYVQLDFVDHGCGIEACDVGQVFDPFFTTKAQGSGLGLTTSARVIADHKGLIEVESRINEGTRVRVYLPRLIEREPANRRVGTRPASKGRILFMDDEEAIRKVAQAMLSYLGYEVCLAEDGTAAIREYQRRRFDIVILDLTVRDGMGGLATLERLRLLDPGVVAIVSSGYSSDPVMADHGRFGFLGRVPKPYTPEALDEAIRPLLGMRSDALSLRSRA